MKYYKILRRLKNGHRRSPMTTNNLSLNYKLNCVNKPKIKNSKLFVYIDMYEATDIYNTFSNKFGLELWRVDCENPKIISGKIIPSFHSISHFSNKDLSKIWKIISDTDYDSSELYTFPCLTLMCEVAVCDSLRLEERIK